jgi:endonuclease/exonuclease/phosphatase family metal-dependent hydrolase
MFDDTSNINLPISAITFGTSSCRDDYRGRLSVMARELQQRAPDILLLQDVFATADHRFNTAAYLARHLGMTCAFHPARPKIRHLDGRPVQSHCGLAVLSRHRLGASAKLELPRDMRDGERIVQFADLEIQGTPLLLANVQLTNLAGTDALRRHQIERIAQLLGETRDYDHILVGGDFNAGRHGASPLALAGARAVLDHADPTTNLFPGDRPALAADLSLPRMRRMQPRFLALQAAAE